VEGYAQAVRCFAGEVRNVVDRHIERQVAAKNQFVVGEFREEGGEFYDAVFAHNVKLVAARKLVGFNLVKQVVGHNLVEQVLAGLVEVGAQALHFAVESLGKYRQVCLALGVRLGKLYQDVVGTVGEHAGGYIDAGNGLVEPAEQDLAADKLGVFADYFNLVDGPLQVDNHVAEVLFVENEVFFGRGPEKPDGLLVDFQDNTVGVNDHRAGGHPLEYG